MPNRTETEPSRREVFRCWARYAVLGVLTGFSAVLLVRGAGASAGGPCSRSASCRECPGLSRCKLPRAVSAKEGMER